MHPISEAENVYFNSKNILKRAGKHLKSSESNGEFIGASQPAQSSRTDGVQTGVPTPVGRVDSSMQTGGVVGAGKRVVTKEVQAKVRAAEPTLYKVI